jgi:hypothetical protein
MKSKRDTAVAKFREGYNCVQSVVYSFCEDLQFEKNAVETMVEILEDST